MLLRAIDKQITRQLSSDEWRTFLAQLENSRYWQTPTCEELLANDGAQWILEGYRDGYYHVVDRQSPESGAYQDACLYLLRTSGLLEDIPSEEIY